MMEMKRRPYLIAWDNYIIVIDYRRNTVIVIESGFECCNYNLFILCDCNNYINYSNEKPINGAVSQNI